ncbi:MAG: hypothetical protein WBK26_04170 [Burkholderiaceae bacterium]
MSTACGCGSAPWPGAVPHAVLAQGRHCKTGFKRRALVALWQPQ